MHSYNFRHRALQALTCITICLPSMLFSATLNDHTDPEITWHEWSAEAFALAREQNKIILLDIGTEWCGACQMMDWFTYTDPDVIDLMKRHFVAIQVDAELQPDIGEKYSAWGWPATIFMTPNGIQVNELAGNRIPGNFIPILKKIIGKHENGSLLEWKTKPFSVAKPASGNLNEIYQRVVKQLDGVYDRKKGGWGMDAKGPLFLHVEQAFFRSHIDQNFLWRDRALYTLDQTTLLIDPVWGGLYTAGINGDWRDAMPEKMTIEQSGSINNFAEAYQLTGQSRWLDYANNVKNYMDEFLRAPDGTYYNSQDMYHKPGSTKLYDRSFYKLDDKQRRAIAIPTIDKTVYTDINAHVIINFISMYEASGDKSFLDDAENIARIFLETRFTEDGWFKHLLISEDELAENRIRKATSYTEESIYLRTQAWMGRALLALYGVSGNYKWLVHAEELATAMQNYLLDDMSGGFFARDPVVGQGIPIISLKDNAVAAHFFTDLAFFTKAKGNKSLLKTAEGALRAVGAPEQIDWEGRIVAAYALALKRFIAGPMEFSIVGNPDDPRSKALFEAATHVYAPRKIIKEALIKSQ